MARVSFEVEQQVSAPAERVWAVLSDYARDHEWRSGVQMRQEPPGPAVTGAITHERLRFLGSEMRVKARVEEVVAGQRLRFRTLESDVPVEGERSVQALGPTCARVTMRMQLSPGGLRGLFARPLSALFQRRVARDLQRLAALLER